MDDAVKMIEVAVSIEFLADPPSGDKPPTPPPVHLIVSQGTNAYDILTEASEKNPSYKFTSTDTSPYGHFITSMDNVWQDPNSNKYWMMYEDPTTLAPTGVDNFYPKNGSNTIFKYQVAKSNVELF